MPFKSPSFRKLFIILMILWWSCPAVVGAVTPSMPARPPQYVVDLAGVLDAATQARLNDELRDLEAKTTAQVVVLTLNSLEGEPIESFSHETAVKWGIGQKGKDNGVLLTVAIKDHKYRIEVGYGLESVLPDSLVGSIGRQYLVPHFEKGDYGGGIMAAAAEMAKIISGGKTVVPGAQGTPPYHWQKKKSSGLSPLTAILLPIFIIMLVIHLFSRIWRRGSGGGFFWFGGGGGGWSSGGGGDSGFSGGGDFGGGGASGDW